MDTMDRITNESLIKQTEHINEIIKDLFSVDIEIKVDYSGGLPSLRIEEGSSIITTALSKPELQVSIRALKNTLLEIGRLRRKQFHEDRALYQVLLS